MEFVSSTCGRVTNKELVCGLNQWWSDKEPVSSTSGGATNKEPVNSTSGGATNKELVYGLPVVERSIKSP
jgi:hypothetical protein